MRVGEHGNAFVPDCAARVIEAYVNLLLSSSCGYASVFPHASVFPLPSVSVVLSPLVTTREHHRVLLCGTAKAAAAPQREQ